MDAGELQRLTAHHGIGKESLVGVRMTGRRQMQATFHIAEHHVRRMEFVDNFPERLRGLGDIHQIDVAGQKQLFCHTLTSR